MENLQETRLLKFHPDTLESVRQSRGLEKPGDMSRSVDILEEWVKQQEHFVKKDFPRKYLEILIVMAKGSVERAKSRLECLCTYRTLMPQFFGDFDIKNDFVEFDGMLFIAILPKLTKNQERVVLIKSTGRNFKKMSTLKTARLMFMICEYLKAHEYCDSFILILDHMETDLAALIPTINWLEYYYALIIFLNGYGTRVKEVHFISPSKLLNTIVNFVKKIIGEKNKSKLHCHSSLESVLKALPKNIIPVDYGGEERSLLELHNDLIEEFSSAEHREYQREMVKARTDETRRDISAFNEEYMGTPGTFRTLNID